MSSTIKAWRTRIVDLLLKCANHTLTDTSVILSGSGCYRFAPNIVVDMARSRAGQGRLDSGRQGHSRSCRWNPAE